MRIERSSLVGRVADVFNALEAFLESQKVLIIDGRQLVFLLFEPQLMPIPDDILGSPKMAIIGIARLSFGACHDIGKGVLVDRIGVSVDALFESQVLLDIGRFGFPVETTGMGTVVFLAEHLLLFLTTTNYICYKHLHPSITPIHSFK